MFGIICGIGQISFKRNDHLSHLPSRHADKGGFDGFDHGPRANHGSGVVDILVKRSSLGST